MKNFWKKYHKWVGLIFSIFILVFCFSGIILNHREYFSECEVSRRWLPKDYHYENWNNGMIKGTTICPDGSIWFYGNAGIWQTDSCLSEFKPLNNGLRKGIDHRKINNITTLPDGSVWCCGLYDFYRLGGSGEWQLMTPADNDERIADVTCKNDKLVVLSRSYIYESVAPYTEFVRHEISAPEGYKPSVSLFRTFWALHSGELFGLPGRLFVDALGVIIIILCITGILYFLMPKVIKRKKRNKKEVKLEAKTLKKSVKWHRKLGKWLIVPTVALAATGMCLRPPLMIPLVMCDVKPLPGSSLDNENAWHGKFRSIRWDEKLNSWLISTSEGFFSLKDFNSKPVAVENTPPISPMGINVFDRYTEDEWLVGSFSGMYRWNPVTGEIVDYIKDKPYTAADYSFFGSASVSGFSGDLSAADEIVFDYAGGAIVNKNGDLKIAAMPKVLTDQPISLWNFALELHTGRCYYPFLGPFSVLFVFIAGLLLTLTLISGYIILNPKKKKKHKKSK